ncbi:lytic transglycosylase domain-containing protein [Aerolutibacter ruishenii]|uniref:Soluble lytic murein transglycosylase-like protein n=1 Tax=Aerolutibacter ruishenii TaxID=686800 RepID=A0A562LPI0_9GAMM|nr:lytic transglycosylase domain-containing protein [Lysobacter ruishenii]TWI09539.1 soluble lytic murein transglycosylase-like protein [Lysobacter ruishenii]
MKGIFLTLGTITLLATAPAVAGTVYRCETADGGRSYVSKRIPGAACTAVGSHSARARGRRTPAPQPVSVGSATPANPVIGSPAKVATPAEIAIASSTLSSPPPPVASKRSSSGGGRVVRGQVYAYVQDGVRHYSSRPPRGDTQALAVRTIKYSYIETCYACGAKPGVNFGSVRLNTQAYRDEIRAAASKFGVDEAVVRAIIHAESAFNPNALSRVGAQGLMQLMPATARRFGVGNAFDASQNIHGGVQYLAWLLKRFKGDLTLAAAGYNAGEGAVDKYKGVPPYSETQRYVQRVGVLADRYRSAGGLQ